MNHAEKDVICQQVWDWTQCPALQLSLCAQQSFVNHSSLSCARSCHLPTFAPLHKRKAAYVYRSLAPPLNSSHMASVPQCLYCFECLNGSLSHRKPLSLEQVEVYWARYTQHISDESYECGQVDREDPDEEGEVMDMDGEDCEESDVEREVLGPHQTDDLKGPTARGMSAPRRSARHQHPSSSSQLSVPGLLNRRSDQLSGSTSESSSSTPSLQSTRSSSTSNTQQTSISSRSSQSSLSVAHRNPRQSPKQQLANGIAKGARAPKEKEQSFPMFVTWNTTSHNGRKSLRGCIGTFDPYELQHGLSTYALMS